MNMSSLHTKHELEALASLALRNVRNSTIKVVSGTLWLTMEGDTRDVILNAGESFTVERDGVTVLAAHTASVVEVRARELNTGWWSRFVGFLDRSFGPAALRPARKWVY